MGTIRSEDILGVSQCDDETGGRNFCYEVITAGRAYLFSADSEPEMNDWISTIKQVSKLLCFSYSNLCISSHSLYTILCVARTFVDVLCVLVYYFCAPFVFLDYSKRCS